jgi:hypothetical protein
VNFFRAAAGYLSEERQGRVKGEQGGKENQLHETQAYLTGLIQYYEIGAFNTVTLPTCDVAMLRWCYVAM